MDEVVFQAKINNIGKGYRFLITIPKKIVKSGIINPSKQYVVVLKEVNKNE